MGFSHSITLYYALDECGQCFAQLWWVNIIKAGSKKAQYTHTDTQHGDNATHVQKFINSWTELLLTSLHHLLLSFFPSALFARLLFNLNKRRAKTQKWHHKLCSTHHTVWLAHVCVCVAGKVNRGVHGATRTLLRPASSHTSASISCSFTTDNIIMCLLFKLQPFCLDLSSALDSIICKYEE